MFYPVNSYRKALLEKDYESIAQTVINYEDLRNKTFFITGATGLIGSFLVRTLLYMNNHYQLGASIYALVRDTDKAQAIYADYLLSNSLQFVKGDVEHFNLEDLPHLDYIIHAAAITASKTMVEHPIDVLKSSFWGTQRILDLAVTHQVQNTLYISSMESYGTMMTEGPIDENQLGYINLWNARTSYPQSKRICESLCNAYAEEKNISIKALRLAQTFGPGIQDSDSRIYVQFARSVIEKRDIELLTKGDSEGNYVYIADAVSAILLLLTKGESGIFNVVNESTHMTIHDMAQLVAHEIAQDTISVQIHVDSEKNKIYPPAIRLQLSAAKLRDLGWKANIGLAEAYCRLIDWLK